MPCRDLVFGAGLGVVVWTGIIWKVSFNPGASCITEVTVLHGVRMIVMQGWAMEAAGSIICVDRVIFNNRENVFNATCAMILSTRTIPLPGPWAPQWGGERVRGCTNNFTITDVRVNIVYFLLQGTQPWGRALYDPSACTQGK